MSEWERLSIRTGSRQLEALYEGVPSHMRVLLDQWLEVNLKPSAWEDLTLCAQLAAQLRVPIQSMTSARGELLAAAHGDDELYLDLLDARLANGNGVDADSLRELLHNGGSAWSVRGDGWGLERRVSNAERAALAEATLLVDEASANLTQAWRLVFGRNPNASDAWDHSIKAVEAVSIPAIVPVRKKATLGVVMAEIRQNPGRYLLRLAPVARVGDGNSEVLLNLMELIWPNPDRHGGGDGRIPTDAEAKDVVQVAVLLVSWFRSGAVAKS